MFIQILPVFCCHWYVIPPPEDNPDDVTFTAEPLQPEFELKEAEPLLGVPVQAVEADIFTSSIKRSLK
jgi:hypothetical protein